MKKLTALIIAVITAAIALAGCTAAEPEQPAKEGTPIELAVFYTDANDLILQSVYGAVNEAQKKGANVSIFSESGGDAFIEKINAWLDENKDAEKGFISVDSEKVLEFFYDEFKKEKVKIGIIYSQSYVIAPRPRDMYNDYLRENGYNVDFKFYYDMFEITDEEVAYLQNRYKDKEGSIVAAIAGSFQYNIQDKHAYRIEMWDSALADTYDKSSKLIYDLIPQMYYEDSARETIESYFPPGNNVLAFIAKDEILVEFARENRNVNCEMIFEGVCNEDVLSWMQNGTISTLFELPNYTMGERSVDAVIDIINGKYTDYLLKADMNILTKEDLAERHRQVKSGQALSLKAER